MSELKTLEELVQLIGPELIQKIDTLTHEYMFWGVAGVTILSSIPMIYTLKKDKTLSLKTFTASLIVSVLPGLLGGTFLGYHAGREYAAHQLSKEYPDKVEYILDWEKRTHIPM